jgi:hypothetical protein
LNALLQRFVEAMVGVVAESRCHVTGEQIYRERITELLEQCLCFGRYGLRVVKVLTTSQFSIFSRWPGFSHTSGTTLACSYFMALWTGEFGGCDAVKHSFGCSSPDVYHRRWSIHFGFSAWAQPKLAMS